MKQLVAHTWPGRCLAVLLCLGAALPAYAGPPAKAKAAALSKARQAEDKAAAAKEAFDRNAFTDALELYRAAQALDPSHLAYTYGIAISAENQGDLDTARATYQEFLDAAPATHPLVPDAQEALARLAPKPAAPVLKARDLPAEATRTKATIVVRDDGPPPAPQHWEVWGAYSLAGAFAVTSVVFAIVAARTDTDANQYRVDGSRAFDPTKISEAGARERLSTINGRWMFAGIFGACAVASGGMGAWLHLRTPAVATDGRSVVLAWAF